MCFSAGMFSALSSFDSCLLVYKRCSSQVKHCNRSHASFVLKEHTGEIQKCTRCHQNFRTLHGTFGNKTTACTSVPVLAEKLCTGGMRHPFYIPKRNTYIQSIRRNPLLNITIQKLWGQSGTWRALGARERLSFGLWG